MEREHRFFLADPESANPSLLAEDERHAATVLRLAPGASLTGLDGLGGLHPLVVVEAARGRLRLERRGTPLRLPEPGTPGSELPRIEVAAALPKGERAEAMLDRLTQLGLGIFRPLACARQQGFPRESAEARLERLLRACREACKQSGRAWLPRIEPTVRPEDLQLELGDCRTALLSPGGSRTLLEWVAQIPSGASGSSGPSGPLAVIAGPEGGFSPEELAALEFAPPVALGPHVLRIETAVEAAVATLVQARYSRATLRP